MISRSIAIAQRRRAALLADGMQGGMPSILRFSSRGQAGRAISNPVKLPVLGGEISELQTEDGMVFIEGYSDPDGPDIVV